MSNTANPSIDPEKEWGAVCILSGGLDSTVALARAVERHGAQNVRAVSFNYGQKHSKELHRARDISEFFDVPHTVHTLKLPSSALSAKDPTQDIPDISYDDIKGVSPTYVPFRNGNFISAAAALAQKWAQDERQNKFLYIGTHAEDAANDAYPDCRLDFIGAMGSAIYIGTYHSVRLSAPLIEHTKAEIVVLGTALGAPLKHTWSCYKGEELHCGVCPTCRARREAFAIAGVVDPTEYAADPE